MGGCNPPQLPGSTRGGKATRDRRQLSSIEMFYFVLPFFFFFFLNILCFLTINHNPRQKPLKGLGMESASLPGLARPATS